MKPVAAWLLLAALLSVEFVLFRGLVAREVAPEPPRYHDQSVYLREAYRTAREASGQGLGSALRAAASRSSATGLLFPIEGAALCLVGGPSRFSALTVNFLFFALLQIAVFLALLSVFRRFAVACFGLGILLLARSPLLWAGGLTDFRIDLTACCLYGVFLATVLQSGFFMSRRWSIVSGLVAGVCILNRYLTMAYFGGLAFAALVLYVILSIARKDLVTVLRLRLSSTLWAVASMLLVAGPALWVCREAIWQYYGVGHFGGDGAIRAHAVGLGAGLFYYPHSILIDHPGPLVLFAVLIAAAGSVFFFDWRRSSGGPGDRRSLLTGGVVFGTAFAVPFAVLAGDPDKSPVAGSILVPPLLLLSVWLLAGLSGYLPGQTPHGAADRFWDRLGPAALVFGVLVFALRATWNGSVRETGREEVVRLHEVAARVALQKGWRTGLVSSDRADDSFDAHTLSVFSIEREGFPAEFNAGLPAGIHAVDPAAALDVVRRSRFVLLTESETRSGGLPFDQSMRPLAAGLTSVCSREFVALDRFQLPGRTAVLWARLLP